jgi:hypothetical protein
MSIEHADLPIAAVRESPWRSEGAHDHRYDRAGQLADQGTAGIAAPCGPGKHERRRYRSDDQAGSEVELLLGRGPFSIPTSFLSAVLKLNSLPFLVVRWSDQHRGLLKSAVTEQEILNVLTRPHIAR